MPLCYYGLRQSLGGDASRSAGPTLARFGTERAPRRLFDRGRHDCLTTYLLKRRDKRLILATCEKLAPNIRCVYLQNCGMLRRRKGVTNVF
jgi:hypothetical protein